ncbi:MAG TPA: DNA polymerase Y family protein [Acidobacteriaceae bacterium]|nr:DNA polymerase Y family protein [Acidobacteriaceae bacterium]
MKSTKEIYVCLYAKEFPVQALLRLRPELREHPCVVMEGEPPLEQVCSLNRKARTLGLAGGMTRVEVNTFAGIAVLARSLEEETAAKAALLECAGGFSPRVEDASTDVAFLCAIDIAGTEKLFGAPEMLARNLLTRVRALGVAACAAVSANFHAALALAKDLTPRAPVQVIPAGEEAAALAALPLPVLDLTQDQADVFSLWGIRTLGMLAALPENELTARMGQTGRVLRQTARGERPHLLQPQEPRFALAERMELESPVEALDALLFVVNRMLEQLILRASARVLALAEVSVKLTLEGGVTHSRTVRPAVPTNDRALWLKLLHLDLEAHPPQAAILAVALEAEPGSTSKVQLGLFSPQLPEPDRLDVTLARLRALVGEGNVGSAVLEDTHRSDGFRMEPFRISGAEPNLQEPAALRPAARRLRPAEAAFVTMLAKRPRTFIFRQRRYTVERAYGPWRSSGDWWNSSLWGCEQWDLIARADDRRMLNCCLMRDVLRDAWQMAALYD